MGRYSRIQMGLPMGLSMGLLMDRQSDRKKGRLWVTMSLDQPSALLATALAELREQCWGLSMEWPMGLPMGLPMDQQSDRKKHWD